MVKLRQDESRTCQDDTYQVTDPNTGEVRTVVSEKYIVCGNYCVRVEFQSGPKVYDSDFFIL